MHTGCGHFNGQAASINRTLRDLASAPCLRVRRQRRPASRV